MIESAGPLFHPNWLAYIVSAVLALVVGFIWYNPKIGFGKAWMRSVGKTESEIQNGFNPVLVFSITFILAFIFALFMDATIELTHAGAQNGKMILASHHTFGHGMLHGAITTIGLVVPVLIIQALFETRSWTNIIVNVGYWVILGALIGGVVDVWNV